MGYNQGLSGSSGKSGSFWEEGDARLAAWLMATPAAPDEGVSVGVPVGRRSHYGLNDLLPGLKAPALERQRAQHLPPWLDQVEIGGVLGLEDHLPARVRQHEQQHVRGTVRAQIVEDDVDPLTRGR